MTFYYHVTIAQERRAPPRNTSIRIGSLSNDVVRNIGAQIDESEIITQLHTITETLGPAWQTDPQIIMVVEWDQVSPLVKQLKGDYTVTNMRFSGWPDVSEETYIPPQVAT